MHKRSMLWAGAGVLLLSNPGDATGEAPEARVADQPFPVPLASAPADYPPAVAPPSRPAAATPVPSRHDESP